MNLPTGLKAKEWFTEEKDLPSEPTNDIFLVKAIDLKTNEEIFTISMFHYWPNRTPIDFDKWRFIDGSECFARYSEDNIYKVVAWAKVKLEYP